MSCSQVLLLLSAVELTSPRLQQAFEPADGGYKGRDPMGPPSFQRWAKIGDHGTPGPETKKYLGCTLLGLRVVVQNRRKDDKVVMVDVAKTVITVGAAMKDALLPKDRKKAVFDKSSNGFVCVIICPLSLTRACVLVSR